MEAATRLDYRNKIMLAPMVRIGTLPTRLLALKFGADIVYCEEIIDHKILNAQRIENKVLGTVDYVLSDTTLVFRTHPAERGKVIFQLGTANARTALRAAKKVEKDVAGIDVNMGCPKEFSLKGGMGAALLKKPETVKEILTTLVQNLSIPVTCKIRLLPQLEDTLSLVRMIEGTGVAAIGVHGRLTEERPRHPNRNHTIKAVAEALSIPVIANGGSKEMQSFEDIEAFRMSTGASSVMIARAAEWNTSIFRREGKLPVMDVVRQYLRTALEMDNGFVNTKYCILMMMHADMDQQEGLDTQDSKCLEEICEIWGMTDYMKQVQEERQRKQQQVDRFCGIKRRKTEDGKVLIEMPIRFIKKDYPVSVSPKLKLHEHCRHNRLGKATYVTTERAEDRLFKSVMELDGTKYTSSVWEKSKQLTEQAAAIIALTVLGEDDGRKPDANSPNDEITRVWREQFQMSDESGYRHKSENCGRVEDSAKVDSANAIVTNSERNTEMVTDSERNTEMVTDGEKNVETVTDGRKNIDERLEAKMVEINDNDVTVPGGLVEGMDVRDKMKNDVNKDVEGRAETGSLDTDAKEGNHTNR